MAEPCHVADQFCTAAANFADNPGTQAKCFACGQAICLKCSTRRKYYSFGRVRLCNDCQVDYDGHDHNVMARLFKLAGYS